MRTMWWFNLRWLAIALLCVSGCWTTEHKIKPPPRPEEYKNPPKDDLKYSSYPTYPKGTLFEDEIKKDLANGRKNDDSNLSGPLSRTSGAMH